MNLYKILIKQKRKLSLTKKTIKNKNEAIIQRKTNDLAVC